MQASELYEFPQTLPFQSSFNPEAAPWEWVKQIKPALEAFDFSASLPEVPAGLHIEGPVFIAEGVKLPSHGTILGPAYIGEGCELRPGVYIRGNVIAGANCVLGNSCEFKNCLLLDGVQVPHYSYVGDSVLGNKAHLGAGAICSNLRLDQAEVIVKDFDGVGHETGMRKLGALIGDGGEAGCNAVLNPGSLLGKRALIAPTLSFRGTLKANEMAFDDTKIKTAPRLD
ncbi:MAG: UDP-N-acetylglucosamine diphosphorylase [Verrucomicrobia bacterium]|nr:UDP-N-acetylglucosamine diphosphorylase [Verrucomicrobiota bacterium]